MSGSDIFEIRVPKSTQWQPAVAATFTNALYEHITSTLSLNLIASHNQLNWLIMTAEDDSLGLETLQKLVQSYYPGAEVDFAELDSFPELPFERRLVVFSRSESNFYETLTTAHNFKSHDPLVMVAQAMSHLEPGELLFYSVDITEIKRYTEAQIFDFLTHSAFKDGYRSQVSVPLSSNPGYIAGWVVGSVIRVPI